MQRTVLVLHGGALGDCVLAIHFARALRNVAPPLVGGAQCQTRVTVAARSSIVQWAAKHGLIDEARSLDAFLKHPTRFDLVVSLMGGPDEPVSLQLRADLDTEPTCIDPRPDDRSELHIVDQWFSKLDCGQSRGRQPADPARFRIDAGVKTALSKRVESWGQPVVLIHPGSGGLSKCCSLDALAGLIPAIRNAGWTPAWMIGPDECERFGESYERQLAATAPILYEESVVAAADLVAAADAYVGMDAGMTHVAALSGVNTVALFGPTDPNVWRPLGPSVHVLPFSATDHPNDVVTCVL